MHRLAGAGGLDGRFAAVGGYWQWFPIPCPHQPHQAVLEGFCTGLQFADSPEDVSEFEGDIDSIGVPLVVPETSNAPPGGDAPHAVVLIVHGADSRAAQCEALSRITCEHRLVIDDFAWVDGQPTKLMPDTIDLGDVELTLDEVVEAGIQPGEQLATVGGFNATDLNDVDPRLMGQGVGVVWFMRVISGTPDADGTADGKVVLVSDATGSVVTTLPLALDPGYDRARLVLDVKGGVGQDGLTRFSVALGDRVIAQDFLSSSLTPFALAPGDYTIRAWAISGAITHPSVNPGCDLELSLAAGDDVSYFARWPGGGDCAWKEGAWPFS